MAATNTVRVDDATHTALRELAAAHHTTLADVLRGLVERAQDERMLAEHNNAMARMRDENPQAWTAFRRELDAWDATLIDGLGDDPWPEGQR